MTPQTTFPKTAACLIGLLALASSVRAEETTMAWHFVASPVGRLIGTDLPLKLTAPPTPTVFANEGDELIDVSAGLRAATKAGNESWLVWNNTRHLLVVHGDARATAYVMWKAQPDQQPLIASTILSWYQGLTPGDPVPADAVPVRRLEIRNRFAQKQSSSWSFPAPAIPASMRSECETVVGEELDSATTRLDLEWIESQGGGAFTWRCLTSINCGFYPLAPSIVMQASSPAGGSWTVTCLSQPLLIDGTSALEARGQIELDGKVAEIPGGNLPPLPKSGPKLKVNDKDGDLMDFRSLDDYPGLSLRKRPQLEASRDPFAPGFSPGDDEPRFDCPLAVTLPELKAIAPLPMFDFRPSLQALGVDLSDTGFAGYEPVSHRLLIFSPRPEVTEKVMQLFSGCYLPPSPNVIVGAQIRPAPDDKVGIVRGIRLSGSVGQRTLLTCIESGHANPRLKLSAEPTLNYDWTAVSLNYELNVNGFDQSSALDEKAILNVPLGGAAASESKHTGPNDRVKKTAELAPLNAHAKP